MLNLTADGEGLDRLQEPVRRLVASLPAGRPAQGGPAPLPQRSRVGIAIPAQVSYVAQVLPAPSYENPLAAPLFVLSRQLSNGILYRRIRVQGGAYGGSCRYEPVSGLFAFLSYRDPHLLETLAVFREAMEKAWREEIPRADMEKAVIGAIGALDRPLDPAGKGYTALIRTFSGLTDGIRSRFRGGVLDITPDQLQAAARRYFLPALDGGIGGIAVCAAEERLREANEAMEEKLVLEKLP